MTLEALIVKMLNNSCPKDSSREDGFQTHTLETHCNVFTVVARPKGKDAEGLPATWELESVSIN
jgi:hypothetical protein